MAFLCITILLCLLQSISAITNNASDAYDILQKNDFPIGLLPNGATGSDFDNSTGRFSVFIPETCTFSVKEDYEFMYKATIAGVIKQDYMYGLRGFWVRSKKHTDLRYFWLPVFDVQRHHDHLKINVGIYSDKFRVSVFQESPNCGCGFRCSDDDHDSI
ncbi:uncharacterized protein LOC126687874 [Mercurialis annua]|uniref:uncharacterized protein LOC126687874 n=1 Tax=Mercurialis annua TaxID=3986 RepID=UPI002160E9A2|nr:uncharacterized protein LOC126687874 [Mercurialis annua]